MVFNTVPNINNMSFYTKDYYEDRSHIKSCYPRKKKKKQDRSKTRILWEVLDVSATLIVGMVSPEPECV
jgi:hypothetical protein